MAINVRCACKNEYATRYQKCPTCGLSKNSKGVGYKVVIRDGSRKHTRLVDSITLARQIEAKLKTELIQERELGIRRAPYLDEVWKEYSSIIKDTSLKTYKKSWEDDFQRWKAFVGPALGTKRMNDIRDDDINRILKTMGQTQNRYGRCYQPATQRQVLMLISRLFSWAIEKKRYKGDNPAQSLSVEVNNERKVYLSDKQCSRLFEAMSNYDAVNSEMAKLAVMFATYTGRRRGEIFALTWDTVHQDQGYVVFEKTKTGEDVITPLSPPAWEIIDRLRELKIENCDLVWHTPEGTSYYTLLDHHWRRICTLAGISMDYRFHDLRHTFGTWLGNSSQVAMPVLQKLMGHKSFTTTLRYLHPIDEEMQNTVDLMEEKVKKARGSKYK
jgi:integrase